MSTPADDLAPLGTRTGVLLVNLGTPDAPESGAVRRYLREFLMDPRVIDIPGPALQAVVIKVVEKLRGVDLVRREDLRNE